jgi:hypothetical protein
VRHNGHYTLRVRDHDSGIPGNQLERALQPFVRLDEARSGDAHCGLGLAIVRGLVRYNGGVIHADNADDGGFAVSMTFRAKGDGLSCCGGCLLTRPERFAVQVAARLLHRCYSVCACLSRGSRRINPSTLRDVARNDDRTMRPVATAGAATARSAATWAAARSATAPTRRRPPPASAQGCAQSGQYRNRQQLLHAFSFDQSTVTRHRRSGVE